MTARSLLLSACLFLTAFTETPVIQKSTPADLSGTLTMPDAPRGVGLLILPGASDRNGNRPGQYNDSLKLLARGLADCGVTTLRVDPRGIGDSTKALPWDLDSFTVDITEADASAWLQILRQRTSRTAVLGTGEGGLTALRIGGSAWKIILLGVPARRPADVLRARIATLGLSGAARARIAEALAALEAGRTADEQPPAIGGLFRQGQTYLISLFKLDPLAELRRSRNPVLVIDGTTDLETLPADGPRLAAARAGIRQITLPFMNHVLRPAAADWQQNMATYERPDLPLEPGLVPAVCTFLTPS